ncbi:MAG: ABC transporter ATP-binding protein [Erysipelotrichaceae bacterium]|nr:ABC transporter ATP-binding protein [Erysipelotrichaceae bacterium]
MITFENIHFSYGDLNVLNGLNLTIEDNSIFGLVGVNGAGKSTLLRILAGIYETQQGTVTLDNSPTYENESTKQQILYLSDDPYFQFNQTLNDLKDFYSNFYTLDEATFNKYTMLFKLDPNKRLANFSKGMKRQSFLVLALSIAPKVLIMDEAFDGLDPFVRIIFKKALFELMDEKDITVIISSHNLKELEDICDSFGILEDGKITTSGDIQDSKDSIHKIQVAFKEEIDPSTIQGLTIITSTQVARVITMVTEGKLEDIQQALAPYHPLLMDVVPINFEELFIYQMMKRGYQL